MGRGRIPVLRIPWRSLVLCGCFLGTPLSAQETDLLGLELVADGSVSIELGNLLETERLRQSLESGLPVRVLIVTELWRDRFFDSQEGREEWRATIVHDPLAATYRVEAAETPLGTTDSAEAAIALLRTAVTSSLRPEEPGDYYYLGRLEVETLSLSDLEELRRWLRGELAPAVDGDEAVGGALGRGFRRIFVRALGLPTLRAQARSPEFNWDG